MAERDEGQPGCDCAAPVLDTGHCDECGQLVVATDDEEKRQPARRQRCCGETEDGKQCRRLARKEGELVTRMEGWAGQRLYCPEHAAEWEDDDAEDDDA